MQNLNDFSIDVEFASADFGDKRLNERVCKLASALACRPSDSFPESIGCRSALEAAYRFLGNPKVTPEKILAPHIESTLKRACDSGHRVVVAHDTTTAALSGKSRAKIGWVNQGSIGFLTHFSLAISRTSTPTALGVLGITLFLGLGGRSQIRKHEAKKIVLQKTSLTDGGAR